MLVIERFKGIVPTGAVDELGWDYIEHGASGVNGSVMPLRETTRGRHTEIYAHKGAFTVEAIRKATQPATSWRHKDFVVTGIRMQLIGILELPEQNIVLPDTLLTLETDKKSTDRRFRFQTDTELRTD